MSIGYLNVDNPNQTGSIQKFSVLTGEPNTWLFVYSGLALIDMWDQCGIFSGGESSSLIVRIVLDNISGEMLGSAATASLANIILGDTDQLAINSVALSLEENGDLVLSVALYGFAGDGDYTQLGSYSYYASAKLLLEAATISGTIRWKKTLATPRPAPHFLITANTEVPPPTGSLLGTSIVEATGLEGTLETTDKAYYYVPYTITGAAREDGISICRPDR